ncbi:TRAP transporter permease [Acuticoccus sp.]|uniref:TRAP transporter permease n=1 Tax=Acuticoccus sp. TaxID=1904378 RepID=UPI003B518CCB
MTGEVVTASTPEDLVRRGLRALAIATSVAMSAYHVVTAYIGTPQAEVHLSLHLLLALSVLFLVHASQRRGPHCAAKISLDLGLVAVSVASTLYLAWDPNYMMNRFTYVQPLTRLEMALGAGLLIVILEAARRTIGWVLVIVLVCFLLYALFGNLLPPPLHHNGFTPQRVIEQSYLTPDGIWNQPLVVTANYIFLFVLFGSLLLSSGAGTFFTDLASALTRRSVGGQAKTAVVASTLMGMLSGSSPANVVTTGSFTIPAMKKAGYKPTFAAGVEAVASTGGQLTPPIMGAAAFLMVEFAGVSYLDVMKAAAIPAALYFVAIYAMVHFEARRLDLQARADPQAPTAWRVLRRKGYLLLSIVAMMWVLFNGYTPTTAGLAAVLSLVILVPLFDPPARRRLGPILLTAMNEAPRLIAPITVACAIGGIIAGIIILTGLGVRVADIILTVSGGSMIAALLLTMVVAVVLGMGMPTASAYIVLAVLLAPGLQQVGVPLIAAHLFIIYCAAKSSITPPVAIASYAAAAIANTNPWQTSLVAFKLGISAFLIPYMFVYGPGLLFAGSVVEIAWTTVTAIVGIVCLSAAAIGWLNVPLAVHERVLAGAAALTLVYADWVSDIAGAVMIAAVLASTTIRRHRRSAARRPLTDLPGP